MNAHASVRRALLAFGSLLLAPAAFTGCDCGGPTGTTLAFTTQPQDAQAGAAFTPALQVSIADGEGHVDTRSTAEVTISLRDNPGGAVLGGTLTRAAVDGVATFPDLSITRAAGGYTLVATSGGLSDAVSGAFAIGSGPPASLAFVQGPSDGVSGSAIAPAVTVSVADSFGNLVAAATSVTMTIDSGPAGAALGGTTTATTVAGVATFPNLTLDLVGTYTLAATSGSLRALTLPGFTIRPSAVASLAFTVQPSTATAGAPVSPAVQVTLRDASGNAVSGATNAVTIELAANPGSSTLSGTLTRSAVDGVATFTDLSLNKLGAGYTLRATSGALPAAVSSAFDVAPGPASRLVFAVGPASTASGAPISPAVQVAIEDAHGNRTTSTAPVTVALGNNPSGATLSGTVTRGAAAGVATFSDLSLDRMGSGYTLAATSAGLGSATSGSFAVSPGPPARLGFTVQPSDAVAGASIAPAVRVGITDAAGNPVSSSSATVTVALGNNPAGGTLSGVTTVAASGGVATFSALSLDRAGPGYTLTAGSPGLTGATSAPFGISSASPHHLAFSAQPSSSSAGAAISPAVQVTVVDVFGNRTGSTATVSVALGANPGGGILSGTLTRAAVAGIATFSNLAINRTGAGYTLAASSPGLGNTTSSPFEITVGAPAAVAFQRQPGNTTAGASIAPALLVAITDSQGNVVTSSTAAVTMALGANPGGGALSGTLTQAAVNGVAAFANLSINRTGAGYTLAAASAGLTGAASNAFAITPGPAARLAFISQPPSTTAGEAITPPVQVGILDALGNQTGSTATVSVALGANPGGGTLAGTTSQPAVAGVATFFSLFITSAGSGYTLVAASASLTGSTSSAFNITAGPATALAFTTQPSSTTAGTNINPSVQVSSVDAFGNPSPSTATVTVSLSTNPGGAALSGTLSHDLVTGVATFDDLSIDRAASGYVLNAFAPGLPQTFSSTFDVTAGPAVRLAFGQQPTSSVMGFTLSPAVTVLVQDGLGNTVPGSTAPVTVAFAANPGGGTLSGTLTRSAAAGVATFNDLSVSAVGNGYALGATSTGLAGATSAPFNILPGASGLVYTDPPAGGKIRLVKNPASTSGTVVLDLVAAVPLTGFQVGFTLPLDASRVQGNAALLTPGTALPAGSPPIAARAVIPATGPLASALVSAQSQKGAGAGAVPANSAVPAGAVFYQLRLDLKPGASTGVVFDGAAPGARFAGTLRDRAGTDVAVSADFQIGRLDAI